MQWPYLTIYQKIACLWLLLLVTGMVKAQDKVVITQPEDTVFFLAHKKGLLGKIGKGLSVNNPDPVIPINGAVKNETPFNPYRGKIIRKIIIEKTGFNKSVNDTTRITRNIFNDIGDALHTSTRSRVIRNNLFFSAGDSLYPYLLADNERYLRSLTYLQDARIIVKDSTGSKDSVDIIVLSKDVFPIGGSMDAGSAKMASFEVNDDNLVGTGNRIQILNFFNSDRNPDYGIGAEFTKRNLLGSFTDFTIGYRNEAPAFNSGLREERALYLLGNLPLVSPYHAWTGGFEAGRHVTRNGFHVDSIYRSDFKYSYDVFDGWIGHVIGAKNMFRENLNSRYKRLVAIRGVRRVFADVPNLFKTAYNYNYSNLTSVLGSFTVFEQDFYHTNFLYGFGRNEDVPEGFSLSFIGGWTNRNNVSRPYLGFDYQRNYFSNRKNYFNYIFRAGGYYNKGQLQDISFLTSLEYFTKLRRFNQSKWFIRHFASGSITQLINTTLNDPLRLSSDYGIPQFQNPFVTATTRATINWETVLYNTWKFVGFSFAPFAFVNASFIKPIGFTFDKGDTYTSIGGGVRTRNENLVFGTIELKAYYYPRIVGTMNQWNITLNTDLRFRYASQLIKRPDFAVVN